METASTLTVETSVFVDTERVTIGRYAIVRRCTTLVYIWKRAYLKYFKVTDNICWWNLQFGHILAFLISSNNCINVCLHVTSLLSCPPWSPLKFSIMSMVAELWWEKWVCIPFLSVKVSNIKIKCVAHKKGEVDGKCKRSFSVPTYASVGFNHFIGVRFTFAVVSALTVVCAWGVIHAPNVVRFRTQWIVHVTFIYVCEVHEMGWYLGKELLEQFGYGKHATVFGNFFVSSGSKASIFWDLAFLRGIRHTETIIKIINTFTFDLMIVYNIDKYCVVLTVAVGRAIQHETREAWARFRSVDAGTLLWAPVVISALVLGYKIIYVMDNTEFNGIKRKSFPVV